MEQNNFDQLLEMVGKTKEVFENKEFKIYFYLPDFKNNTLFFICNIYNQIKNLKELGYNCVVLSDKNDYKVPEWLEKELRDVNVITLENSPKIEAHDFIVVPEFAMPFISELAKQQGATQNVVLHVNAYEDILNTMPVGARWQDLGIVDVIVNSPPMEKYVTRLMGHPLRTHVIPIVVSEKFKNTEKEKRPYVAVMARDEGQFHRFFKEFILKYPMLKFISFVYLKGKPRNEFANILNEAAFAVWIDEVASLGSFPLECFRTNTPLVALRPKLPQEFHTKGYGIWANSRMEIEDYMNQLLTYWLEDQMNEGGENSPNSHFEKAYEYSLQFNDENQKNALKNTWEKLVGDRIQIAEEFLKEQTQKQ